MGIGQKFIWGGFYVFQNAHTHTHFHGIENPPGRGSLYRKSFGGCSEYSFHTPVCMSSGAWGFTLTGHRSETGSNDKKVFVVDVLDRCKDS